jgi:hypothetical protein
LILLVVVVLLGFTWARAFYGSMKAYQSGEALLEQKQFIRAITYFDRSIHWYTPFNPYVEKSARKLWGIGEEAEKQGDLTLALIAFRTIRGGFIAASHFVTPGKDWIERSESRINDLLVKEGKEKSLSQGEKGLPGASGQTQKDPAPDVFWTVVLEIGFLGWVGSLIAFIFFRWGPKKRLGRSPLHAFRWVGLALVFFALWIVGLMKA